MTFTLEILSNFYFFLEGGGGGGGYQIRQQTVYEITQFKDVGDRSAIMVCEAKFGSKFLPVYSPIDIKVKQQLQLQ